MYVIPLVPPEPDSDADYLSGLDTPIYRLHDHLLGQRG
jgi:hypothetical protein